MLITVLAQAVMVFRGDGTGINAFLFLILEWSDNQATLLERTTIAVVTGVTLIGVLRPTWYFLLPAGLYLLVEACAAVFVGGRAFAEWTPAAAALRFGTPLLAPYVLRPWFERDSRGRDASVSASFTAGCWLLRVALGVVFILHGYEALQHHAVFIDLIIGTGNRLFGIWLPESSVTTALTVIGSVDVVVGAAVLLKGNRVIFGWMMIWGLITAMSRMTANGWDAYPDVMLRATHFMVPLALYMLGPLFPFRTFRVFLGRSTNHSNPQEQT